MDINMILTSEFSEVNKAYFEKEANFEFLRVEVKLRDLNEVVEISKKISQFLDDKDVISKEYYLDVFSAGTDENIQIENMKDYIGENVKVVLNKNIKEFSEFIGELIEVNTDEILIKWNAKGQFRKQQISIDNIKNINKYVKVKKR